MAGRRLIMPDGATARGNNAALAGIAVLAQELCDLKRVRDARSEVSVASRLFRRAWWRLGDGAEPDDVALEITADAIAAARLGAMDSTILRQHGADPLAVQQASYDLVAGPVAAGLRRHLRAALASGADDIGLRPGAAFVEMLIAQPRAGATCPGKPRLMLEPPEGHGDHCLLVAVLGVILSGHFGGDRATPFITGLAHHFHNTTLPDSGLTGEMLLGDALLPVIERATETVTVSLPPPLQSIVRAALRTITQTDTAEARSFHAADVIDRVLQMQHYARMAAFTLDQALDEQNLVHEGPVKLFHDRVLRDAGLL